MYFVHFINSYRESLYTYNKIVKFVLEAHFFLNEILTYKPHINSNDSHIRNYGCRSRIGPLGENRKDSYLIRQKWNHLYLVWAVTEMSIFELK